MTDVNDNWPISPERQKHYLKLADQARLLAAGMIDPKAYEAMLQIAAHYDLLAQRVAPPSEEQSSTNLTDQQSAGGKELSSG
jgi:hypothetical protein